MDFWHEGVMLAARGLSTLTVALGGNLGLAIFVVSLVLRLALLPWTLRLARSGEEQREKIAALQPELERLRARHADDPSRLAEATLALYREKGVRMLDPRVFGQLAVQLPVFALLSEVIRRGVEAGGRFLWIADLAKPDALLTLAVAGIGMVATAFNPHLPKGNVWMTTALPAAITLFFMWKLSAGLGLYWGASGLVSVVQSALLRRPKR